MLFLPHSDPNFNGILLGDIGVHLLKLGDKVAGIVGVKAPDTANLLTEIDVGTTLLEEGLLISNTDGSNSTPYPWSAEQTAGGRAVAKILLEPVVLVKPWGGSVEELAALLAGVVAGPEGELPKVTQRHFDWTVVSHQEVHELGSGDGDIGKYYFNDTLVAFVGFWDARDGERVVAYGPIQSENTGVSGLQYSEFERGIRYDEWIQDDARTPHNRHRWYAGAMSADSERPLQDLLPPPPGS